jgi:mitochondrial translocator assembly and maintenance protein 41
VRSATHRARWIPSGAQSLGAALKKLQYERLQPGAPPFLAICRQYASKSPANDNVSENAEESVETEKESDSATSSATEDSSSVSKAASEASSSTTNPTSDWEDHVDLGISHFNELPHKKFGHNQHMLIDDDFKEALRQIPWQFKAPVRFAFAYGSGVFPQSKPDGRVPSEEEIRRIHPKAPASVLRAQGSTPKMIDFVFGVTYTQHWHDLNLRHNRDHYSGLGSLGSGAVSHVQDQWGAGVYYNTYVVVNGMLIKYGVINLDTLCRDLSEWDTMYIAGRLHKPVKILRDNPRVRLANQINLLSAVRTALLLLPEAFTEQELYSTIAGLSYLGDPRMRLPTEDPSKVANIVGNNTAHFRRLYVPLIENLPNVEFNDPACMTDSWIADPTANLKLRQDMDPVKRGNMVRRLPKAFRARLYFQYQKQFGIPRRDFLAMMEETKDEDADGIKRQQGGGFERRIAQDDPQQLRDHVRGVIKNTITWPSTTQSIKGVLTAGVSKSLRYVYEKRQKYRNSASKADSGEKPAQEAKNEPIEESSKESAKVEDKKSS